MKEKILNYETKHPFDKGSFWFLVGAIFLFIFSALYDTFYLHWQFSHSSSLFYVGLCFFLLGLFLRIIGEQILGKNFSVFVDVQEEHQLITTGMYRWVRHPIYSAGILKALGIIFITQSILTTVVLACILFPALLYRIHVEEDALIAIFGDQYLDYKKRVKALVPWVI